ncbi:MAG: aldo/keto reductase [Pseudonocardiaceae bacterium]
MTDVSRPMNAADVHVLGGDLPVRRLGFGAMRITGSGVWGEPADRDGAKALLRRVLELGVNLIDTADSYGPEVSELLIAEALYPYPADLVIATKGGLLRDGPHQWRRDGRPAHLRAVCEGSLRRLRLERIDLYQLHAVDPRVPIEESVGALVELQDAGLVRHIGVCNVSAQQLERARGIAEVVSVQNRYNLAERGSDDLVEACGREGLAFLPWYPLATGELAAPGSRLDQAAKAHGATAAQVALAWLLARSPTMLPIPGTGSIEHFEENMGAARVDITPQELAAIAGRA